jgi:tetratricopeptide (TPR) repeat protein
VSFQDDEFLAKASRVDEFTEKIQKKVDELHNIIESHKQDIEKLKQRAERELWRKLEEINNIRPEEMTPEQEEIVKEAVEEIEKKPEEEYSAEDYFTRGIQAGIEGKHEDEIKYYQKVIQLNPDFVTPYYRLARAYSLKKDKENTIKYLEKAVDKGFDNIKSIEQNPRLDFIRNTPEYRRIIKKLKAKM